MDWTEAISKAVQYIEDNIIEDISAEDVANHVNISAYYFQKGFSLLCGYTITEYIRNRRLALAAGEIASGNIKIIDAALKYGYNSPDSFTKAFTRFHGVTPSMVQKNGTMIKIFAPLKIKLSLEGGYIMEYKLVKKDSFVVMGVLKEFSYGMFGVNIDEPMAGSGTFKYMIADAYNPAMDIPEGFITKMIPEFTWAVFPCRGAMPDALQDVNKKIFSEWLPALKEYEFAAGYCIEMYDDASKYPNGNEDKNYYSEIWIPVKKK